MINSCPGSTFTRNLDHKLYELTDHLGNVRVVISDIKESVINGTTNLPENFTATVEGYYNYYAFGAEMTGRNYTNTSYRYGFNSQEKDNEVAGNGNSYTAEFWQYDSRLGRRWNVDPVIKGHESSYAAYSNNPICFIDPNGNDTLTFMRTDNCSQSFVHPDLEKKTVKVNQDILDDKTDTLPTGVNLPDAIGYNVEAQAGAESHGMVGLEFKTGGSAVVFTRGDYAWKPHYYNYLGGGVNLSKSKPAPLSSNATTSVCFNGGVSIQFFGATFTGPDENLTPRSWTGYFESQSFSLSYYEGVGGGVGVTTFNGTAFDKAEKDALAKDGTWIGCSIDIYGGVGGGWKFGYQPLAYTYYTLVQPTVGGPTNRPLKTKEISTASKAASWLYMLCPQGPVPLTLPKATKVENR